jgi:hypothetical protein
LGYKRQKNPVRPGSILNLIEDFEAGNEEPLHLSGLEFGQSSRIDSTVFERRLRREVIDQTGEDAFG